MCYRFLCGDYEDRNARLSSYYHTVSWCVHRRAFNFELIYRFPQNFLWMSAVGDRMLQFAPDFQHLVVTK